MVKASGPSAKSFTCNQITNVLFPACLPSLPVGEQEFKAKKNGALILKSKQRESKSKWLGVRH